MEMNKPMPPSLALRFFQWYCHPRLRDHIEGDLLEVYQKRVKKSGKRKADLQFTIDVLLLLRPGIIRRGNKNHSINQVDMLQHYFTIGWRNLLRNKGYSFINIGGLALGMTVAMLIGLWVYDEVSFNNYYPNHNQVAQVLRRASNIQTQEKKVSEALQIPVATALKANYSHYFKHVVMAFWPGEYALSVGDNKSTHVGRFMEGEVLDMLSIKMIEGSHASLNDPHSIILSESLAHAFFGNEDPINKTMKIDNRMDVTVTGVFEDMPANTDFSDITFFAPWDLWVISNQWVKDAETNWGNSSFGAYVQIDPSISMQTANAAVTDFFLKNVPPELTKDVKKHNVELALYPMNQWHLYSEFKNGVPAGGRITFVWLFAVVGVFALLLACINFMNLSTARSEKRAREVGVRKAIGSVRSLLVQQFLSESFIVVMMAFVISITLATASLPLFNELAAKQLSLPFFNPYFWLISLVFIIITGLAASAYPAFYLSSFQPVKVLKGTIRTGRLAALPRKILVVLQFSVSVTLIIGTTIVYKQIQYARNRPIGYNREGIITIRRNDPNYDGKLETLRNELLNSGVVTDMVTSTSPLTAVWNNIGGFNWKGKDPEMPSDFSVTNVSPDFGKMVGWEFKDGRDFSRDLITDSSSIVINETAANYLGLKNPVGEMITTTYDAQSWQIIGVIKDMIMTSPYEPEKRAFFFLHNRYSQPTQIHIKIKPTESAAVAIPKIESVFKKIVPSASFDYKFVDDEYAEKFSQEMRIGKLATVFATLAIIISCLGLFGLASYVAEQRTKEIGVRKVLGASVFNLWKMLSKDFVVLVMIAVIISIPIATYFMNNWLLSFNYRTDISPWVFALAGSGALLITLLTVSYQSIKAAKGNPVKSLRSE
jgi:predicted permease